MSVDEIVDAFRAQHSFAAGPVQGFSWDDVVADSVFERLPASIEDDDEVEVCKIVANFLTSISNASSVAAHVKTNPMGLPWYNLLKRIGWIGGFSLKIAHLTRDTDFDEIVELWKAEFGFVTFKDFFNLMCRLRKAKAKMIEKASKQTLKELRAEISPNPNVSLDAVAASFVNDLMKQIRSRKSPFAIWGERAGAAGAADDAGITTAVEVNDRWINVQMNVLTIYKVLPNDENLRILQRYRHPSILEVAGGAAAADSSRISSASLWYFLWSFYYVSLVASHRRLRVHDILKPVVRNDVLLLRSLLSVDAEFYAYIPNEIRTQDLANRASWSHDALQMIERKFRNSVDYMLSAWKHGEIRLLNVDVAPALTDTSEGEKFFHEVLSVVGTGGRLGNDFFQNRAGFPSADWWEYTLQQVMKLQNEPFERHNDVVRANPNCIVFFDDDAFIESKWVEYGPQVFDLLNDVMISDIELSDSPIRSRFRIMCYMMDNNAFSKDAFKALLFKGFDSASKELLEIFLNDRGGVAREMRWRPTDNAMENAWSNADIIEIFVYIFKSFELDYVIWDMVAFGELSHTKHDMLKKALQLSNFNSLKFYQNRFSLLLEGPLLMLESREYLTHAEMIDIFADHFKTGGTYQNFKSLFEQNTFDFDEKARLYGLWGDVNEGLEHAAFRVLYVAMAQSHTAAARIISNFVVVSDVGPPDSMRIHPDDFKQLAEFYASLTNGGELSSKPTD